MRSLFDASSLTAIRTRLFSRGKGGIELHRLRELAQRFEMKHVIVRAKEGTPKGYL